MARQTWFADSRHCTQPQAGGRGEATLIGFLPTSETELWLVEEGEREGEGEEKKAPLGDETEPISVSMRC